MKLLHNIAAAVSLVYLAVGPCWLGELGLFSTGLGRCILALSSAVALTAGVHLFTLRERIAAWEKRVNEGAT